MATLEPTWPTLGVAYQAQAAEAGIRVNVVQTPSDGYWNRIWMKKDISATRWKERPADQALHEIYLSTAKWNESFFKDSAFDELLATARRELNFEKRKVSLSIRLLEEIMNAKAIKEHSSPLSGKNLPFSSLSEQLDDKKNKKETE